MTTAEKLMPVLDGALAGTGLLLEEVTVSPAGRRRIVRVVIDRDLGPVDVVEDASTPLSLDEVADATRVVGAALDDGDVMGQAPYTLEVTSPGVSRPLTTPRHFARNIGRLVTLIGDGEPVTGRLRRLDHGVVTLDLPASGKEPGRSLSVDLDGVRRGEVQIEFNRPDAGPDDQES